MHINGHYSTSSCISIRLVIRPRMLLQVCNIYNGHVVRHSRAPLLRQNNTPLLYQSTTASHHEAHSPVPATNASGSNTTTATKCSSNSLRPTNQNTARSTATSCSPLRSHVAGGVASSSSSSPASGATSGATSQGRQLPKLPPRAHESRLLARRSLLRHEQRSHSLDSSFEETPAIARQPIAKKQESQKDIHQMNGKMCLYFACFIVYY